jgi:Fe-S-cluster formation regulator IscX/YfhJ
MFRPVQIAAVLNGWIVSVGCQTVVYQDRSQLITDLDQYLRDPDSTEKRFLETAINHNIVTGAGLGQLNQVAAPPTRDYEAAQAMPSERIFKR